MKEKNQIDCNFVLPLQNQFLEKIESIKRSVE